MTDCNWYFFSLRHKITLQTGGHDIKINQSSSLKVQLTSIERIKALKKTIYLEVFIHVEILFVPQNKKFKLIKILTHRALMICSKSKLDAKIEFIFATTVFS